MERERIWEKNKRRWSKRRERKAERTALSLPSCFEWISSVGLSTANRRKRGGSLAMGGEKWRDRWEGVSCLHERGEQIRNLNHCGMRKAFWHQFSWQPENYAACSIHTCKQNVAGDGGREGPRDEERGKLLIKVYQHASRKTLNGEDKGRR